MKLDALTIRNFKGVKKFALEANGQNVNIFGDNATGKTTIFDALLWLLFGKDSKNKAKFALKPLDGDGKEINNLEVEVFAALSLDDGNLLLLKKVYKELWVKKSRKPVPEFSGHTTDYYIDDVPVQEKMFQAAIQELMPEELFRLLTNPAYFNEVLKDADRRRILLEVCGDLTDEDVIAANGELSALTAILSGRKLEDHRKVIAARKSEINQKLKEIPVRINQEQKSVEDISGLNADMLKKDIVAISKQRQAKQEEIVRIEAGGEIAEKNKRLAEIAAAKLAMMSDKTDEVVKKRSDLNARKQNLKNDIDDLRRQAGNYGKTVADNSAAIAGINAKLDALRAEYKEINGKTFNGDCICPTCGQDLPEAMRAEAAAKFNADKAKRLEENIASGKALLGNIARLDSERGQLGAAAEAATTDAEKLDLALEALEVQIKELDTVGQEYLAAPEYLELIAEEEAVKADIALLNSSAAEKVTQIKVSIGVCGSEIAERQKGLLAIEHSAASQKRVGELTAEQKKLAAEFEKLEQELYLADEFIRTKVKLMETNINSKFKYARFKLFHQQVDGGLADCCETTVNGVPYGTGLNNAARINVGLDIINTLGKHYKQSAPVFIDNREAVTKLLPIDTQVISLIVSAPDKALRVEFEREGI